MASTIQGTASGNVTINYRIIIETVELEEIVGLNKESIILSAFKSCPDIEIHSLYKEIFFQCRK